MTNHLTAQELTGFRNGTLETGAFRRVDQHLKECSGCRRLYQALAPVPPPMPELARELATAGPLHVSYEQLAAYVDGARLAQVEAHLAICAACAAEVKHLQAFDAAIGVGKAPVKQMKPVKQAKQVQVAVPQHPGFWDRVRQMWFAPHSPVLSAAAFAMLIVGVAMIGVHAGMPGAARPDGSPSSDAFFSLQLHYADPVRFLTGLGLALAGAWVLLYRWLRK